MNFYMTYKNKNGLRENFDDESDDEWVDESVKKHSEGD